MTPVEATSTACGFAPACCATSEAILFVSRTPRSPVHALALPLFANTARTCRFGSTLSHQSTDEARTAFVVKAPAALQGASLTSKPQSGPFDALMPAAAADAEKPCAAVTPPCISHTRAFFDPVVPMFSPPLSTSY
jgi:hypothetical protein